MSLTNNDCVKITETPKKPIKTPGIVGLTNLGNTCFMNAGLQCLLNSPSIIKFFLENYKYDSNKEQVTLIESFAGLVLRCWSGKFSVISPVNFKASLGNHKSEFKNNRQHDCQEFLTVLLDSLHEDLNFYSLNTIPTLTSQVVTVSNEECASSGGDCLPKPCVEIQLSNAEASTYSDSNNILNDNNSNLIQISNNSNVILTENNCINETKSNEDLDSPSRMQHKNSSTWDSDNKDAMITRKDAQKVGLTHETIEKPQFTDDYFTKDTKTLNTNVSVEAEEVQLNTDSNKFLKSNSKRNDMTNNSHTTVDTNELSMVFSDSLAKPNPAEEMPYKHCDINNFCLKNNEFCDVHCKNKNSNNLNYNNDTKLVDKCCGKGLCNDEENGYKGSKRIKIDNNCAKNLKVLNLQLLSAPCEEDSPLSSEPSSSPPMSFHSGDDVNGEEALQREGMQAWLNYSSRNRNVIVDNLQGLFRSTVICNECNHLSATFEPFMYLSLPIPRAFDQQLVIHYVPWKHTEDTVSKGHQDQLQNQHTIIKFSLTVDRRKDVKSIIKQLTEFIEENFNDCASIENNLNNANIKSNKNKINCSKVTKTYNNRINKTVNNDNDCHNNSAINCNQSTTETSATLQDKLILAEVLNNRILRILEETMSVRLINHVSRQLFAFSLPSVSFFSFPQVVSNVTSLHTTSLLIPQLPPEQLETIVEEHHQPGVHSFQYSSVSETITVIPGLLHEKVIEPLVLPQGEQIGHGNSFCKQLIEQCPMPPSPFSFETSENNFDENVEVTKSYTDLKDPLQNPDDFNDRKSLNEDINKKSTPVKKDMEFNQKTDQLENTDNDPKDKTGFMVHESNFEDRHQSILSFESDKTFDIIPHCQYITDDVTFKTYMLDQLLRHVRPNPSEVWLRVDSFGCMVSVDIPEAVVQSSPVQSPDEVFKNDENTTALNNTKLAKSVSPRANLDASPHINRMYNNLDYNDKKNNILKCDRNDNGDALENKDDVDKNDKSVSDEYKKISSLSSICNSSEHLGIDETCHEDRIKQTTEWLYCPTNNLVEGNDSFDVVESQNEFANYNDNPNVDEDKNTCKNINMTINNNLCTANNEHVWKTCAICLDEIHDSQLRVHPSCKGIICSHCLEKLFQVHEYRFNCQVCQMGVSGIEDFVTLDQTNCQEQTIKTLVMRVSFRGKLNDNLNYFSVPRLLYLPSQVNITNLYTYIKEVVPFPHLLFSLHLVDSQGLRCSRCPLVKNCSGCKINRDFSKQTTTNQHEPKVHVSTPRFPTASSSNTIDSLDPQNTSNHPSLHFTFSELNVQQNQSETRHDTPFPHESTSVAATSLTSHNHPPTPQLAFLPSDNLVVSYGELSHTKLQFKQIDHISMQQNMNEPISLMECFENFSKSESLDSSNSWHCSRCDRKKQAHQCISIEKFPNTLIVHLKRFVFQGGMVTKINSQVDFPLVDFRPKPDAVYDLQGFICHSGGVDAGHYIAYSKHLKTREWFRFNDETSQRKEPSNNDQAYVLFYQLKDSCDDNFEIPQNLTFLEEDQKTNQGSNLLNCLDLSISNSNLSRNNSANNSITRRNSLTNIKDHFRGVSHMV